MPQCFRFDERPVKFSSLQLRGESESEAERTLQLRRIEFEKRRMRKELKKRKKKQRSAISLTDQMNERLLYSDRGVEDCYPGLSERSAGGVRRRGVDHVDEYGDRPWIVEGRGDGGMFEKEYAKPSTVRESRRGIDYIRR